MAQEARIFTADQTLAAIKDVVEKQGDTLWIKVQRRAHMGGPGNLVATFSGAVMQHVTSPELWLPEVCGGGKFLLQISHESSPGTMIGGSISLPIDTIEPRDVNIDCTKQATWQGPAKLEFPKRQERPAVEQLPAYGISPPAPGPGNGASGTTPEAWPRSAGGGVHRAQYGEDTSWQGQARAIEAERRELEKAKLQAEVDRHRAEVEALRRSHESDIKGLEARMASKFDSLAAARTGPDPMVEFMKMQAEDRRAAAAAAAEERRIERERQDRIDARAAEDRRVAEQRAIDDRKAERERQDRADARFEKMLEKMASEKKDPLEMMKTAKDLMKSDNEGMMKSIHSMAEMSSTVSSIAMDLVSAAADMQLGSRGPEEPGWVKGGEKLLKGLAALTARRPMAPPAGPPQQPQQQLPPQTPQQPNQPQPPPAAKQLNELTMIEQFELAVRQKADVKVIANSLLEHYDDESIQQALANAGGDPERAIYERLGNWANESDENRAYMTALMQELEKQLQGAGKFSPDEPEQDGDEPEGEDEPEGDEGGDE